MKPHRIRMCHSLVMNYGLYNKMEIYVGFSSLFRYQDTKNTSFDSLAAIEEREAGTVESAVYSIQYGQMTKYNEN